LKPNLGVSEVSFGELDGVTSGDVFGFNKVKLRFGLESRPYSCEGLVGARRNRRVKQMTRVNMRMPTIPTVIAKAATRPFRGGGNEALEVEVGDDESSMVLVNGIFETVNLCFQTRMKRAWVAQFQEYREILTETAE